MFILILGAVILAIVLLQSFAYKKFWDTGLVLRFAFSVTEAFEGDTASLNATLENKKFLPLPWLLVEYQLSTHLIFTGGSGLEVGEVVKSGLYSVMMYRRIRRKMPFVCGKRGYYRLRRVRLAGSNLLHTQTFTKDIVCASALTVFPSLLEDLDSLSLTLNNLEALLLTHALINPDPFTFRGIREYLPTDPLRNINPKASAITQQLMVNIHAPTSSKRLEIILNLEHYTLQPKDALFEQAIRLAATLAQRYIAGEVMVGLYTNGRDAITGDSAHIGAGTHASQLYAIYHALGRLALAFKPGPISGYLDTLQDGGCVYALISTYHGADMLAALQAMKARGLSAITIIPVDGEMEVKITPSPSITLWEAMT
ncbi:MAG: DUF58 domain-containing protein [Defluviitaleaceae bacterium]|nr:DUF58 domain-containing protein [Defluviitaleaceae bacterium]MCL2239355.1 DUF58 domain-containing protein [Defluviitaleaceae bacterium]